MQPENLSIEQLRQLQQQWYRDAGADGTLRLIRLVACELGAELGAKYGPKYQWAGHDIVIYRDEYGGYTSVTVGGQLVCSTHVTNELFVPGDWVEKVKDLAVFALRSAEAKTAERNERLRLELMERLGLLRQEMPMGDVVEE